MSTIPSSVEATETVLEVEDLSVTYRMGDEPDVPAVRDASFTVERGKTFGIVGESGCGKTTAMRALIGLLDDNGEVTGGQVELNGRDLTTLSDAELRAVRWSEVAMIPQNVMNALNPVETVGSQIVDVICLHTDRSREAARAHAEDLFDRVGLDPSRMNDYPHEFSGGMLQRAVIAMAISCDPDLLVADEPTTALDVVVQDEILDELASIQEEFDLSVLVISHDIGVMAEICDDIAVMYAGEVMERGRVEDVFVDSANPYTLGLKNSFPSVDDADKELVSIPGTAPDPTNQPSGCVFRDRCPFATEECAEVEPDLQEAPGGTGHVSKCHYVDDIERIREEATDPAKWGGAESLADARTPTDEPLVEVEGLRKYFDNDRSLVDTLLGREPEPVRAVDDVDFTVNRGEFFGIVGESGSGKSTLGRLLLKLIEPTDGSIRFDGTDLTAIDRGDEHAFRRDAQVIFQDPFESLNPRLTVQQTLLEPLSILGEVDSYSEQVDYAERVLEDVGLSPAEEYLRRFPDQLSGGERQRVAIARALVVDPEFIVADEPVSMLDVSIRANVLNLLERLGVERDLTFGIISHDISLVRNVCDRTGVMYLGEFVELGRTADLVDDPKHPYTKALVDSVPVPDPTVDRKGASIAGETPSPRDPPTGCRFHTRCPEVIPPAEFEFEPGQFRSVMDLRQDLAADRLRLNAVGERADGEVVEQLKAEYFEEFRDPNAEAVIDEALEAVATGETDEALALLEDAFETPCETDVPEYHEVDGIYVACHLYSEE
ncbi:dipeptide ABC transporter ATP-binding protein (plasmid) [Halorussus salilacus]|uniref:ABC transporter ATP-binding protein n=1 Tax=Halorussus salilacus TaxID=2953750 RepID=UPI00209E1B6A|nr:dipeptide ABC transporter ATP-binding protein [Halorussus salilacus]USZ70187.1 dipeptide ABC transporter ATP-binding protein [Halorussus salilacus]